jgi:hypothetical protein
MHENQYHNASSFVTLTYKTECLPEDRSLSKRTLQLFIKRLRKWLGDTKIKYYACGEYGPAHDREHYHLIIFGWKPPLEDLYVACRKKGKVYYGSKRILALWPYGFNTVGNVTRDSCQYVSGYVRKKLSGPLAGSVYQGRVPPFAMQSAGHGGRWCIDNRKRLQDDLSVIEGSKNLGLPRYYQRILNIDPGMLMIRAKMKETDKLYAFTDLGYSADEINEFSNAAAAQKEKEMLWMEKNARRHL